MAPDIVYAEKNCPYEGCDQLMQAIDFRLEEHGHAVYDALVRAWWDDTGFAGQCPLCEGWIYFTIREKKVTTKAEAANYPQLPDDWSRKATIL